MTRDGFHLSEGIGRYCAALTAASKFFDIESVSFVPSEFPEVANNIDKIKQAVIKAQEICKEYLK